ncbi:MAG: YdeI/OmpD-associated family protein [Bacteroidales bacterium]
MKYSKTVNEFISNHEEWKDILEKLREIMLSMGMEETVKWGIPVYMVKKKNVVGIGAFKSYAGLWFYQGALLDDPENVLINAQEEKTRAMRQWRFTSVEEIDEKLIRAYTEEAIENARAGREIKPERREFEIPKELQQVLDEDEDLRKNYNTMTYSHRREFAEYISEAKRPDTRQRRLHKIMPMIMKRLGMYDRFK